MRVKLELEVEIEDLQNNHDLEEYLKYEFNYGQGVKLDNIYLEEEAEYEVVKFSLEL